MNSAERIKEYSKIAQEAPATLEGNRPADTWPSKGEIEFKGVSYRYRENLPLVLKEVLPLLLILF